MADGGHMFVFDTDVSRDVYDLRAATDRDTVERTNRNRVCWFQPFCPSDSNPNGKRSKNDYNNGLHGVTVRKRFTGRLYSVVFFSILYCFFFIIALQILNVLNGLY